MVKKYLGSFCNLNAATPVYVFPENWCLARVRVPVGDSVWLVPSWVELLRDSLVAVFMVFLNSRIWLIVILIETGGLSSTLRQLYSVATHSDATCRLVYSTTSCRSQGSSVLDRVGCKELVQVLGRRPITCTDARRGP